MSYLSADTAVLNGITNKLAFLQHERPFALPLCKFLNRKMCAFITANYYGRSDINYSEQKIRAFWNICSHGLAWWLSQLSGFQGHCQVLNTRSGCGINARCLPSSEQRPAIPSGLPLGLNGYCSVISFVSLTYRSGAKLEVTT